MPKNMKERAYDSSNDEEKAEHELREKEKCLENGEQSEENGTNNPSNKRTRVQELGEHAKRLTSQKSLIVIILLCVLLIIFFIIIIALAVQIGYLRKRNEPYVCDSAECFRAASQVAGSLNSTIDPCNDFWTFACGSWLQQNPLPTRIGSYSVTDSIKSDVNWKLRHLIDLVPENANAWNPEWKVKRFYSVCMDVATLEYSSLPKLKDIIVQLGGWSLLQNWEPQRWDRSRVIDRLQTEFGVTPFFKITVEPDDRSPTSSIIKILPSGLGLPSSHYYHKSSNSKYESSYRTLLDNFARQIGPTSTTAEAAEFANTIFGYEKRIAEITPPPEAYRKPELYYKKLSIRELEASAQTIPWLEILQNYYPQGGITEHTEIAVFDENYFKSVSSIISSTDNLTLHQYLMWQLALKYINQLPANYRLMANKFYQEKEGVEDSNEMAQPRWEYCLDLTNKYFGNALGAMYVKSYFVSENNAEAEAIEEQIQKSFINQVGSIPWAQDSKTTEAIKGKMTQMLSLRGYPDFISNPDTLKKFYDELSVQSNFLENIFHGEKFLKSLKEKMIGKPVSSESSWSISAQDVTSLYNYNGNSFVIAAGLLQLPVFSPTSPNPIKYGSLGTMIGSQLFKAFDEKGVMYQKFGDLTPWLMDRSEKYFERESTCIKEKIGNETITGNIHTNADLVLGEAIADLAAVKYAFKAYKDASQGGSLDLPGLKATNDELFFISYAQSMCQNIRLNKILAENDSSTSSANQLRVLRTLKQLPEFSEVFECSSGSQMNPQTKCHLW